MEKGLGDKTARKIIITIQNSDRDRASGIDFKFI